MIRDDFNVNVGAAIRAQRTGLGWTQVKVAEVAGLSPNYIARLERGELGPSLHVAHKIALALNMPIGWLVGENDRRRADRAKDDDAYAKAMKTRAA